MTGIPVGYYLGPLSSLGFVFGLYVTHYFRLFLFELLVVYFVYSNGQNLLESNSMPNKYSGPETARLHNMCTDTFPIDAEKYFG